MSYVYHHVPEYFMGSVLYPMNKLEYIDEKLHKLYRSGYEGREHLLKREIPYLNCLWNDVIHCCPVHPQKIIDTLKEAGVKNIPIKEYFEIDINSDIDINNAVIFYRNSDKPGDVKFKKANQEDWNKVDVIPKLTLDYYKQVAKTNEPLFLFHGIPHFLYKGKIETKTIKKITPKI